MLGRQLGWKWLPSPNRVFPSFCFPQHKKRSEQNWGSDIGWAGWNKEVKAGRLPLNHPQHLLPDVKRLRGWGLRNVAWLTPGVRKQELPPREHRLTWGFWVWSWVTAWYPKRKLPHRHQEPPAFWWHIAWKQQQKRGQGLKPSKPEIPSVWLTSLTSRSALLFCKLQAASLGPDGVPLPSLICTLRVRGSESRAVLFRPLIPRTLFLQPLDYVRSQVVDLSLWWGGGWSRARVSPGEAKAQAWWGEKACWMMALGTKSHQGRRASPVLLTLLDSTERQGKMLQKSLSPVWDFLLLFLLGVTWSCPALDHLCTLKRKRWAG